MEYLCLNCDDKNNSEEFYEKGYESDDENMKWDQWKQCLVNVSFPKLRYFKASYLPRSVEALGWLSFIGILKIWSTYV
jgi:hypothetical protein